MVATLGAIDELTPDWLTQSLGQPVNDVSHEAIVGVGYASRMYRIKPVYASATTDKSQPESLILKLATDVAAQLEMLEQSLLAREVHFYSAFADDLVDLIPRIYVAEADLEQLQVTLLMEDLGNLPSKPWAENLDNSIAAVKALARLHAQFWNSPDLGSDAMRPTLAATEPGKLRQLLQDNIKAEHDADYSVPYLTRFFSHVIKLSDYLVEKASNFSGPATLLHGDFHCRNIHFTDSGAILYDWQMAERGPPTKDLVYWMNLSVDAADFHAFFQPLCDAYLSELKQCGIDYPLRQFKRDMGQSAVKIASMVYCLQTLVDPAAVEKDFVSNNLLRAEQMAKKFHLLGVMRLMRITLPLTYTIRRWLNRRKLNS